MPPEDLPHEGGQQRHHHGGDGQREELRAVPQRQEGLRHEGLREMP
ncbi:MAG: hypothetical protein MZU97_08835 [Bacillus subtilis]|nr:hypothetical protein [Bacillus subtilis]